MILETMLQRLYASLVHGPCINCRPHGSRQRVDFASFSKFNHLPPTEALKRLLAGSTVDIRASVKPFAPIPDRALYPEEQQKKAAWEDQQKLISKIAGIIEDSVEYEQETGEYALNIGFPLLCLQPSEDSELNFGAKIMAPIAFLPVELTLKRGAVQALSIKPKGEGTDFLIPNPALFAWLEQQTNQDMGELFADPEGKEPLREINEIIAFLLKALELDFDAREVTPEFQLAPAPRAEELGKKPFLSYSAVLGVFPVSNQGLLRDTRAMMEEPNLTGPVVQFLHTDALDVTKIEQLPTQKFSRSRRIFAEENLTTVADPFQARAVKLARECPNLVIHGPPGTGKSQTITNIISDHLAHGERVLFVCDKRTALDVVKNRMDHLGLGHLCAVVHDPQRDQRDLYLGIRNQLEALADNPKHPAVSDELAK
ncbi:MAG: AAA domain-containing protein, partial [Verrucomicrobiales bacterium]